MLKARELGYDTLIMGLRDVDKLVEIFEIPNDEAMMAVIALGKRKNDPEKPQRKTIDEILTIM